MPPMRKRSVYDFRLGPAVKKVQDDELLKMIRAQLHLGQLALKGGERYQALARMEAAQELVEEARLRGDQLRLRI